MGYFRELPNLLYQSFLPSKNSSLDYVETKNLFRRTKLRDDLQNIFTLFDKYEIPDEYRPENVAEDYYGSDELDWVVLMNANIVNVRDEWPLANRDIYDYSLNKYGDELNETRFYETKEIKDSKGRLILPEGKVVDSGFVLTYYDGGNQEVKGVNVRTGVSNYIYETRLNDKKRNIYLLKPSYLQQFLNDFREVMIYGRTSQYVDDDLIKTENTNITMA
tara:strand:+ start:580 stop:1236 length:657 start_codon:yes stop_codon:yes gene_type:complete